MNKPRYQIIYKQRVFIDGFDLSKNGAETVMTMQEVEEWIEVIKSVKWECYSVYDLITNKPIITEKNNEHPKN